MRDRAPLWVIGGGKALHAGSSVSSQRGDEP
jgi:hypothetical protein